MKFLDIDGVETLWEKIKEKFVDFNSIMIKDPLQIVTPNLFVCALRPSGQVRLAQDDSQSSGDIYMIGLYDGNSFHNITQCLTPVIAAGQMKCLVRTTDRYRLKRCIIKSTIDDKFYAPDAAGLVLKQCDTFIDALDYLIGSAADASSSSN